MNGEEPAGAVARRYTAADVADILRERGWLEPDAPSLGKSPAEEAGRKATSGAEALVQDDAAAARLKPCPDELEAWLEGAGALLGPHAADASELGRLLALVFEYDARTILASPESHAVLAREGAREVIRELAHRVLDGPEIDSDRFKEIVSALKTKLHYSGRELFHPIRLALAGRAGEGELDRVILLLDSAAKLAFRVPVKGTRQRMLEFCAALE